MWALVIPSAKWNQRTKGSTSSIWDPASWESIPLVATWHGKHGKELGFYPHISWMKARGNIKGQRLGMFIFTQLLKPIAIHWVSENNRFFFSPHVGCQKPEIKVSVGLFSLQRFYAKVCSLPCPAQLTRKFFGWCPHHFNVFFFIILILTTMIILHPPFSPKTYSASVLSTYLFRAIWIIQDKLLVWGFNVPRHMKYLGIWKKIFEGSNI